MSEILQHNFETIKPTSVFTTTIVDPDMVDKLVEEIKKSGDKQDHKTNVKAYMTDWNMSGKPGFDEFEKGVLDITKFLSKKYYRREIQPRISDMWGMIYNKGNYAITHDHWPALWSFAYYLNAPKDAPGLFFPEMGEQGGERKLEQGLFIMFEGHIKHAVRQTKFKGYRYAVSGNLHEVIND